MVNVIIYTVWTAQPLQQETMACRAGCNSQQQQQQQREFLSLPLRRHRLLGSTSILWFYKVKTSECGVKFSLHLAEVQLCLDPPTSSWLMPLNLRDNTDF